MKGSGAALVPFALGMLALVASACGGGTDASTQITITIHYSHFLPESVTVPAGTAVTITLRNEDPIEHEWIVGTPEVHERHRTGTEPFHDQIPTEVTVPALESRTTTVTFERPGEYLYICHLPGHEAYGMVGRLHAVED
jgi:uncharacterized cupredoxin-like copper-binding protein